MGELNESLCYEENAGQLTETVVTQIAQTIRKVGGVIPVPAKGLRTTGALIRPRAGEDQCLSWAFRQGGNKSSLPFLFVLFKSLMVWMVPTHTEYGNLLECIHWFDSKARLIWKRPPKIMLRSERPMAQPIGTYNQPWQCGTLRKRKHSSHCLYTIKYGKKINIWSIRENRIR